MEKGLSNTKIDSNIFFLNTLKQKSMIPVEEEPSLFYSLSPPIPSFTQKKKNTHFQCHGNRAIRMPRVWLIRFKSDLQFLQPPSPSILCVLSVMAQTPASRDVSVSRACDGGISNWIPSWTRRCVRLNLTNYLIWRRHCMQRQGKKRAGWTIQRFRNKRDETAKEGEEKEKKKKSRSASFVGDEG